jgi:YHS domain-containing protein
MKTKSIVTAFSLFASSVLFAAGETPAKETVKPYKPDTCIVSGEKLGEMGEPYVFVHEGQEIKLCCKSCLKKFNKEPGKYLKKLEEKK